MQELGELCLIFVTRNKIQERRQRARASANYRERIMERKKWKDKKGRTDGINANYTSWQKEQHDKLPAKWKKAPKSLALSEWKKFKAHQYLADSELHLLTAKTHKRVRQLLKQLNATQQLASGSNSVSGIRLQDRRISKKEMESIAEDFLFERDFFNVLEETLSNGTRSKKS